MVNYSYKLEVPESVSFKLQEGYVFIFTKKYTKKLKLPNTIHTFEVKDGQLFIEGSNKSQVNTIYSIIDSLFTTITAPCKVVVTSSAMGTKFQEYEGKFYVKAGHSHFIELPSSNLCEYLILNQSSIMVSSHIKQEATNLAARICNIKRPDVYKAKGLYIEGLEPKVTKSVKK